MVERLSRLGAGQHSHNGLMKLLLGQCNFGSLISKFPGEEVSHAILPSRWIHVLRHYPHEFKPLLGAARPKLRHFWQEFLAQPLNREVAINHPVVAGMSLDDLATVVPLTLHLDAAPYTKRKSVVCISFSSLLATGCFACVLWCSLMLPVLLSAYSVFCFWLLI